MATPMSDVDYAEGRKTGEGGDIGENCGVKLYSLRRAAPPLRVNHRSKVSKRTTSMSTQLLFPSGNPFLLSPVDELFASPQISHIVKFEEKKMRFI
ncbi:hypothetical protein V9T40_014160 [Parthenolecanium corni]|uniref:Uncharacterized protein n=1 Tax=Parthenolecanium corni TaxID=536013 RepID=A0AAN9Y235_9HEMI